MNELNITDCTATFTLKPHSEFPMRLFYLDGKATHPKHGEIAELKGYAIRRRHDWLEADDFLEAMDLESSGMRNLTIDIFDNSVEAYPWLIDGSRRSGSKVWDEELNEGDIFYIEYIQVNDQFLRRGVGSWLLRELLRSPHCMPPSSRVPEDEKMTRFREAMGYKSTPSHALIFCDPEPARIGSSLTERDKVSFFQKSGFRRVGRTSVLGYLTDPEHASHKLAIEDDSISLEQEFSGPVDTTSETLKAQFPLHAAIADMISGLDIEVFIHTEYAKDPTSIHRTNSVGFTPAHIATITRNRRALSVLLELGMTDDLHNSNNRLGTTPLECEYLLKQALNVPTMAVSEQDYVAKRKLGCTCGECTEGWFSPRMRYRLSATALDHYEMNIDLFEDLLKDAKKTDDSVDVTWYMHNIPPGLHSKADEEFCRTWIVLHHAIHKFLQTPQIPTLERLSSLPDSRKLIAKGGKLLYVLDSLTRTAKEQSPLGDGYFEECNSPEYEQFPSCDNDLIFDLVRKRLELNGPRLKWAPHFLSMFFRNMEEEFEEESDEDNSDEDLDDDDEDEETDEDENSS